MRSQRTSTRRIRGAMRPNFSRSPPGFLHSFRSSATFEPTLEAELSSTASFWAVLDQRCLSSLPACSHKTSPLALRPRSSRCGGRSLWNTGRSPVSPEPSLSALFVSPPFCVNSGAWSEEGRDPQPWDSCPQLLCSDEQVPVAGVLALQRNLSSILNIKLKLKILKIIVINNVTKTIFSKKILKILCLCLSLIP